MSANMLITSNKISVIFLLFFQLYEANMMTNGYNKWQVMGNWCFTRRLDTTWTTPKKNSQKNERCFAQLIEWLIVWLKENGQDQMQRGFNLHFSENVKFYCWTSDVSSTHNQGKTVSRIISIKISVKVVTIAGNFVVRSQELVSLSW